MSGHGGSRSGAGRPKGGISQTRRLLSSAITKGLATAGRSKFGSDISGDDEQAATQTAAMIVADMIQAGQGSDVLKLWAQVANKDNGEDTDKGTSLESALKALPSASRVSLVANKADDQTQTPEQSDTYNAGTTDNESDAPVIQPDGETYFAPQQPLLMDGPARPQPAGGHPPSRSTRTTIDLHGENFEKMQEPDFGDRF